MTNKIIAAAREAGFSAENGRIFANCESSPAHVLCTNAASALYALAYRQGLEDAANVCDTEICTCCWEDDASAAAEHLANTIRAMKEKDHG